MADKMTAGDGRLLRAALDAVGVERVQWYEVEIAIGVNVVKVLRLVGLGATERKRRADVRRQARAWVRGLVVGKVVKVRS